MFVQVRNAHTQTLRNTHRLHRQLNIQNIMSADTTFFFTILYYINIVYLNNYVVQINQNENGHKPIRMDTSHHLHSKKICNAHNHPATLKHLLISSAY